MRYLILAICVCVVLAGLVWLDLSHRRRMKAEKIRLSLLSAEEIEQEEYEDWRRRQW